MCKKPSHSNDRFAWLTPLSGHLNGNGPWVISEENTALLDSRLSEPCRKVTHSCLLQMLSDVLDIPTTVSSWATEASWQSSCGRFSVKWNRSDSNNSRLFVQRAEDYFSRFELHYDDQLLIAFQDPVWPQLQNDTAGTSNHLPILIDCLDALETGALAKTSLSNAPEQTFSIASAA